ncbi:hypothetical protein G6F56_000011 [Rhizopus delemar]|uniref:Synapse-associated protein 1 n=1 Tax=Rhizopus stolonifer TaxID=4846 RepID=A0A367KYK9_RHIST|nr:hypothetical protein G6F56_000011 [Rhizopus delemar]RCI07200.1 Synapse-associated protein 1 [Rhizopus stolonifer]
MTSGINSLSQSIQTKSLPEFNKHLTKLQQQAKELPGRIGNFQMDLESERSMFISDKKKQENISTSQSKGSEPVAPWFGYKGYETQMKYAIMEIPKDKRNLLISPPDDTNIQFDFNAYSLSAHAALKEDKELARLRFLLVPQHVSEHDFWKNYFYRVTLIKQDILSHPPESVVEKNEQVLFDFQEKEESDEEIVVVEKDTAPESVDIEPIDLKAKNVGTNEIKEGYEGMEEWEIELRKAAI